MLNRFLSLALAVSLALAAPAHAHGISTADGPASASAQGNVSTGTQSFAGDKTFLGLTSVTSFTMSSGVASFTGGTAGVGALTVTKTNESSAVDIIAQFGFSGAALSAGGIDLVNNNTGNSTASPMIRMTSNTAAANGIIRFTGTGDTGTVGVGSLDARIGTSTAVATRPLFTFTNASTIVADITTNGLRLNAQTAFIRMGTGDPEAAITAPVGSVFIRTDGGALTCLYIKESGVGNTGWIAK